MVKNDSRKISTLIAFCKLFLGNVRVEILLISGHFWWVLDAPPALPFIAMPVFMQMKGVEVVHMPRKFCLHLTCHSRVFIFQKFCKLLLGGILEITPRKVVKMI